ncbi:hypothetical protein AB0E77_28820 [Streptomyces sp. NPDC032940]|uniref:hypothetical protein n=1 Tax=Streptomyces sp. NPDC032940 TaxID=3155366 RepID=UPI0033F7D119
MRSMVRTAALSTVFVAVLTACGGAVNTAGAGDGGSGRQGGGTGAGQERKAPATLTTTQMQTALAGEDGIPDGWGGRGTDLYEGTEAVEHCGSDAGTGCAGLTAMAMRTLENQTLEELQAGIDGQSMYLKLYSFDTVENAVVTAEAIAAAEREEAGESDPLDITTAAEYTDAFSEELGPDEYSATVVMRTGAVVITVWGMDLESTNDMQPIAKGRVDRVLKVAAGRNPDA